MTYLGDYPFKSADGGLKCKFEKLDDLVEDFISLWSDGGIEGDLHTSRGMSFADYSKFVADNQFIHSFLESKFKDLEDFALVVAKDFSKSP
ncbi:MAG: hypothetical protein EOP06_03815 [Proteobacteria bacterium]|nr:MAG: hypothetical protein EOP06_03815 [Pseudomonadota bacterium]